MTELLIGCGKDRTKRIWVYGKTEWEDLTTLDINPSHDPDVVWDLELFPYPFEDDAFDEVHAYEVLEHTGNQGDYRFFFMQFDELWRILKPDGWLMGTVPWHESEWAIGDPGHVRVFHPNNFVFLIRERYEQVGRTAMTDYRDCFVSDWEVGTLEQQGNSLVFALRAIKG